MHRFGPETKWTTDLGQERNERTQSTFLDPIVMFWFILVRFVTEQKTMTGCIECTDSGRNRNELPIHARKETNAPNPLFLDPIVMFCFVLVSLVTMPKAMLGLHLMHRVGLEMKGCSDSGYKRNERTQSTFLDPIVMFWFVLVSFVTVPETMPGSHLMLRVGPEMKRCTDSG